MSYKTTPAAPLRKKWVFDCKANRRGQWKGETVLASTAEMIPNVKKIFQCGAEGASYLPIYPKPHEEVVEVILRYRNGSTGRWRTLEG